MYVFPGIGLAAILSKATSITDAMIYASAASLSTSLTPAEKAAGNLYPELRRIREVSVTVARGVIRAAQEAGLDREPALRGLTDDQMDEYIRERMYDPFEPDRGAWVEAEPEPKPEVKVHEEKEVVAKVVEAVAAVEKKEEAKIEVKKEEQPAEKPVEQAKAAPKPVFVEEEPKVPCLWTPSRTIRGGGVHLHPSMSRY